MGIKLQCQLKTRVKGMLALDARIFVAGHRGMVGSSILRALQAKGYTNLVLKTSAEMDLRNQQVVADFFAVEKPDYVFLADPWWNPFTMKQAEDRAHRMGQSKTVMSYKFITKDTIEEKILALQQKKTKLAESIIPDEDTIINNINVEELEELLS